MQMTEDALDKLADYMVGLSQHLPTGLDTHVMKTFALPTKDAGKCTYHRCCPVCKTEFDTTRSDKKFCSTACRNTYRHHADECSEICHKICMSCGTIFETTDPYAEYCPEHEDKIKTEEARLKRLIAYKKEEADRKKRAIAKKQKYVPIPFKFHVKKFNSISTGTLRDKNKHTHVQTWCSHCGKPFEYDTKAQISWHIIRAFCSDACEYDYCYRSKGDKCKLKGDTKGLLLKIPAAQKKRSTGKTRHVTQDQKERLIKLLQVNELKALTEVEYDEMLALLKSSGDNESYIKWRSLKSQYVKRILNRV